MKLQDSYEGIIAEQIAEVALLRTNMVLVQKSLDTGADLIAFQKNEPSVFFLVEVKATALSDKEIQKKYQKIITEITNKSKKDKYILFFIDTEKKTGFFEIIHNGTRRGMHQLSINALTNQLGSFFGELIGMEFPPYTFHTTKLTTTAIPIEGKFKLLRLHNLTLSPIDNKSRFAIDVTVEQGGRKKTYPFPFSRLFHNPNLKEYLFFVTGDKEYTDIVLPSGLKRVTVSVDAPANLDFEIKLACEYLTHHVEKRAWG